MAREIEVKILEINRREVEGKLRRLGARKVFDGMVETIVYDFPDRKLKDNDVLFRLRRMGGREILGCKTDSSHDEVKSMEELELDVADGKTLERILALIGLEPIVHSRKHRVAYALGRYHIDIDKMPGIPTYIEIEAPNKTAIFALVKKLGYEPSDAKPWGTNKLLKHYGIE